MQDELSLLDLHIALFDIIYIISCIDGSTDKSENKRLQDYRAKDWLLFKPFFEDKTLIVQDAELEAESSRLNDMTQQNLVKRFHSAIYSIVKRKEFIKEYEGFGRTLLDYIYGMIQSDQRIRVSEKRLFDMLKENLNVADKNNSVK